MIVECIENPYVPFSKIERGEVFVDDNREYYMKVDLTLNGGKPILNSVNLHNGAAYFFPENELVRRVNAKVQIIKGE